MRNAWAGLAAALLAAAFFLPAQMSKWGDRRLLDDPHITRQDEEREGFAESLQLPVAEKLLLLRSGNVASVPLEDMESLAQASAVLGEPSLYAEEVNVWVHIPGARAEAEETAKQWEERAAKAQSELRGLQTAGALPCLWDSETEVTCSGHSQTLYIDRDSQVSFLAYDLYLSAPPYSIRLTADAKTNRILAFRLSWVKGPAPNWGYRGSVRFGAAWRDYWGMDSVSSTWNSEDIRTVLEAPPEESLRSGSYNSNAGITFNYGGQTLRVPLVNWVYSSTDGVLEWNTL